MTLSTRLRRLAGFTLVETMITVTILTIVIGIISVGFLSMLQLERSNNVTTNYISQAMKLKRLLRKYGVAATRIVTPDGTRVEIVNIDGTTSLIQYEDDDGDWRTIENNRIVFIENVALVGDSGTLIINLVTPPNGGASPIFAKENASGGYSALRVEFVVGDWTRDPAASCNRLTGPGYQSYSFRSRISPRNAA